MENVSNIDKLLEIAEFINAKNLIAELNAIKERATQGRNAELLVPLVGEFSSGKTTLINALTDCKQLQTASKPMTSTLYEIHFGCEKCRATIMNEAGEIEEVEDIASLKNENLGDAVVVNIYDTSSRVPATTILVDTPGLSSPNPKHKAKLVEILPFADAIFLLTDVNQQITRTLTDFIETMKLSNRPMYLVITMCDTKAKNEIEKVKQYLSDNCKLPIQQMICVSAKQNELNELYTLFETIQKDKDNILAKANDYRIKNIISELLLQIEELISHSTSDSSLDEAIRKKDYELRRLNNNIDGLIHDMGASIKDKGTAISRKFEDEISTKLERLVTSKSDNFDQEAISLINNTSNLLLDDYKTQIVAILADNVRKNRKTENDIPLHSLSEIDLSTLSINGISYNLNLNSLGHQHDGVIANVTKGVIAVAAVATVVATAGVAAPEALGAVELIDVADTVSDVASIASNRQHRNDLEVAAKKIQNVAAYAEDVQEQLGVVETYNQQMGRSLGAKKGLVESMVGFVTDNTMGRPQRQRAIREYLETLLPRFKEEMEKIALQITNKIGEALHNEAASTIALKEEVLRALKTESSENKAKFMQRIKQLKDYKTQLLTFKN